MIVFLFACEGRDFIVICSLLSVFVNLHILVPGTMDVNKQTEIPDLSKCPFLVREDRQHEIPTQQMLMRCREVRQGAWASWCLVFVSPHLARCRLIDPP